MHFSSHDNYSNLLLLDDMFRTLQYKDILQYLLEFRFEITQKALNMKAYILVQK